MWERLIEISPEQGVETDRQTVGVDLGRSRDGQRAVGGSAAFDAGSAGRKGARSSARARGGDGSSGHVWPRRSRRRPSSDEALAEFTEGEATTSSGLPRRRAAEAHKAVEPSADLLSSGALDVPSPSPLPRRTGSRSFSTAPLADQTTARASSRSPEEIRSLLSSYRSGLTQGRLSDALKSRTNGSANGAENGEQS